MEPNKLIYVVDENRINLLLISRKMKESFRCETRLFKNSKKSIETTGNEMPDLILMHYKIGISRNRITGERLLPILQDQYPDCAIVMYTSIEKLNVAIRLMKKQQEQKSNTIEKDDLKELLAVSLQ